MLIEMKRNVIFRNVKEEQAGCRGGRTLAPRLSGATGEPLALVPTPGGASCT